MSCCFCPIFSSLRPRLKPGVSASTTIIDNPPSESLPPVRATTRQKFANLPLVMKVFDPLITHSLPSSRAVVRMPRRSLPVPGSVMAIEPTSSPEQHPGT